MILRKGFLDDPRVAGVRVLPRWSDRESPKFATIGATGGNLGPDLIDNGSFAADTGWTKEAAWTIPSPFGKAVYADTANSSITQALAITAGLWRVDFDVLDVTAGTATIRVNAFIGGTAWDFYGTLGSPFANGSYSAMTAFTLTGNATLQFRAYTSSGSAFSITNVRLRKVF